MITTDELRRYADEALPELSARFDATLARQVGPSAANPRPTPRMQSTAGRPFPLVRVPGR